MINIYDFVNKWNGKYNNFDGAYGCQCTDICKEWEKANSWPITHGNAIDYMRGETGYTVSWNTPSGIPRPGDLAVVQVGAYGHIGIVVSADINRVTLFNQNYPLGHACCLTNFGYATRYVKTNKVIGWLRKN